MPEVPDPKPGDIVQLRNGAKVTIKLWSHNNGHEDKFLAFKHHTGGYQVYLRSDIRRIYPL